MDEDQDTLESGQDSETEGAPTPKFESGGDQRPSTVNVDDIAAALQTKLGTWLDGELDKRLQSQKDRRFSKLEKQFGDVDARLERFATLMESGLKPDQARHQLEVEEAIEYVRQQRQSAPQGVSPVNRSVQGGAEHEQAMAEANQLLKATGLDGDPAWAEILRTRTFKDGADYQRAAVSFIAKRTKEGPPENAATIIQPGGGSLPKPDLEAAYWNEVNAAKGQGAAKGREIREKYRKLGLNV